MDTGDIHVSIDKMYEELYFTKVKNWAESMGMPGEVTARRILRTPTRNDTSICRGKMNGTGKRCTKKAKCNGYCGYHKSQFKEIPQRQIQWNRQNTENDVPVDLVIP